MLKNTKASEQSGAFVHAKVEGIFRRTGDVLIWLTDDQNHVPVKFVTSIALGQVTAELISSDAQRSGEAEAEK